MPGVRLPFPGSSHFCHSELSSQEELPRKSVETPILLPNFIPILPPRSPTLPHAQASPHSPKMVKAKAEKQDDKQKAFTIKYKRPRMLMACLVCRQRKVRCDLVLRRPCSNCVTFGCECVIPETKKRTSMGEPRPKKLKNDDNDSDSDGADDHSEDNAQPTPARPESRPDPGRNEPIFNISQVTVPPSLTSSYKTRPSIHKQIASAKGGRVPLTFLGSLSITFMLQVGQNHVQLPEELYDNDTQDDADELELLKARGAFLLPLAELTRDLVDLYFEHVHPLMPVINRLEFVRKLEDPDDAPSLMVLQAVLLCGSRVLANPLLRDLKGLSHLALLTFFRRAKALYENNYESDAVSIIQTVLLIGLFWDGPEDVTRNLFYWTRVAIGLAQGFGFQRDISHLPELLAVDKKIWRRVWWCLFEKDRNVAVAFGRPSVIDLNDCDVPMLTVDDFDELDPETGVPALYKVNETQALYFIHLVKLAEITGIIIKHQYTVKAELMKRKNKFLVIQHCDMLMGIWFTNLPPQLVFSLTDPNTQNFFSCLLNAQYYNRLYLIHRANLLRMAKLLSTNANNYKYPSWGILFQAARMISIVSKILLDKGQIKYCPVMFVYILFSALMMLIYHVDLLNSVIASTAADLLFILRAVLKELSRHWSVATILLKLFDKYANDKILRAKIIASSSRQAELLESKDTPHSSINPFYTTSLNGRSEAFSNGRQEPFSPGLTALGISPGGTRHEAPKNAPKLDFSQPKQPNIDQLIQLVKHPKNTELKPAPATERSTGETSPSSTQSFPDISLVTESLPTNHNFFENFEPTQLFPTANFSIPPSRAASPGPAALGNAENSENADHLVPSFGSNIYAALGNPTQPTTPSNELFNTNFIDSLFINMNLQTSFNEDLGLFFNFQM